MNKDIHCLKKWDEVIIFNNEIFYTPPERSCSESRRTSGLVINHATEQEVSRGQSSFVIAKQDKGLNL